MYEWLFNIKNEACGSKKFGKKLHKMPTIFNVFLLEQTIRHTYYFMDTTVRHSAISVKQATIGTVFLENLTQVILIYI